jgi:acyl dehydratase
MPPIETRQTLTRADVVLYALGIGSTELPFVYEEGLRTLPTMAATLAYPGFIWRDPRFGINWRRVLHGETSVTIHTPLPAEGELIGLTTIGPIFDKGVEKGAIACQTREIHLSDGAHLATVRNTTMLRDEGGFGGSPDGQPRPHPIPERKADIVHILPTAANQAMIYRLSGDLNPLHIDPAVAAAAGFPRPILHGLATYGLAGRAILATLCDNEPERLKRLDVRFSSPVFPGETIEVEVWRDGADNDKGRAAFRATVRERDEIVLNNGYAEFA